jgi:hypothetical protein
MSKPAWPGVTHASIVVALQLGQGGRGIIFMMLALDQAGAQHSQSPIGADTGAVMETSMLSGSPESVANTAHIPKEING